MEAYLRVGKSTQGLVSGRRRTYKGMANTAAGSSPWVGEWLVNRESGAFCVVLSDRNTGCCDVGCRMADVVVGAGVPESVNSHNH